MPKGGKHVGKIASKGSSSAQRSSMSGSSSSRAQEVSASVASILEELKSLIKQTHDGREASELTLTGINKTHEKIKNEPRVSLYFKQKLQSQYLNAVQASKREQALIEQCLRKVDEVKKEINVGEVQSGRSAPPAAPRSMDDYQAKIRSGMGTMRRGMLMTVLQQYAVEQPVWRGSPGDVPPPLCGCIPADDKYRCKPSDQVAARVRTEDGEEQWILAEVFSYNSSNHRYCVDDIDEEGHNEQRRYHVSKRRIVPLPRYKADPQTNPEALFRPRQLVLALYPQTTCFYRAIIDSPPRDVTGEYSVLFEDNTYPEGYSPALDVHQRYVLPMRETKKNKS